MSNDVHEQYRPRLCHVVKWPHFQGYGFSLHAEKGKAGQFIGKIDEGSPAESAGLKDGDRIVEVNGVNIGNENHQQVVTRIKSGGEETRLLVVDAGTDKWYKDSKKIIRGDLPEVLFISSNPENDHHNADHGQVNGDDEAEDSHSDTRRESSTASTPLHNGNITNEDTAYRPRLCHLKYWTHYEGYGFNLHAEKGKPGQFIGLVDDNSPSSTGGLRVNDRIIEVNGVNVEKEEHPEVIARIKAVRGETRLLVVDKETDMYYQRKGVTVSSSMPQTEHIITPDSADAVPVLKTERQSSVETKSQYTLPPPARQESSSPSPTAKLADGLELHLSVAEMKERLKANKKQDPRLNKIPFEEKFKEFQRM
ncbi:hypothetical protein BsWGS_18992 [Bradybaena similaris]